MLHFAGRTAPPLRDRPSRPFVLVVDDDEAVRIVLEAILQDAGLEVVMACDGAEALDRLRDDPPPQLVILDLLMPRVAGWRVLATMREGPRLSNVPVVVLTGCGEPRSLPKGYPVLHKPVDAAVVLALVKELLAQRRADDSAIHEPPSDLLPRSTLRPPRG